MFLVHRKRVEVQSFFLQLCCPPGELRCHFVGSGAVCFRAVLVAGRPDRPENSCLRGQRVGPGQKKGRNGSGRKILGIVRHCFGVKIFYSGDILSPTNKFLLQHCHRRYSFQIVRTAFPFVVKRFRVSKYSIIIFTNRLHFALKLACLEA